MDQPRSRTEPNGSAFSIEKYGEKTSEKEECEEELLAEYAFMLAFYIASVAGATGVALSRDLLPRRVSLFDLALLGVATHKLSRMIAKDRITGILRAPFVCYVRSAGSGEVEEEPRGRGIQRGIGKLISCPYCMGAWCAAALAFGFVFAPRASRFLSGILVTIGISDFLHQGYARLRDD